MITRRIFWVVLAAAVAGGCQPDGTQTLRPLKPEPVPSNIARADYIGSAACRDCHGKIYQRWRDSPMRNMTRTAVLGPPAAPFDGRTFHFQGDRATLLTRDDRRYLILQSKYVGRQVYRISEIIGGRYREDYVGVRVARVGGPPLGDPRNARVMPVSWVRFDRTLRYKGYSVMVPERPGLKPGSRWMETCVFCHNTVPQLSTIYDDLYGPGAPVYQGRVSDQEIPESRRWRLRVTDTGELERLLRAELERLWGGPRGSRAGWRPLLRHAARSTARRFRRRDFVEVGIGCEACHGGSRAHVATPRLRPSFAVRSPAVAATPPAGVAASSRAAQINRTCARCHTVLFTRYPWTWEGGLRWHQPGGSNVNSGEGRDFLLGSCSKAMACTACHDPHGHDDRTALARLGTVAGNTTCVGCHPRYRTPEALQAHTHHRARSAGSACLACHMPRKNMGLAYDLTRYHRIASPTDRVKVQRDRPLECALCHADQSVERLVTTMEKWWNKRYDRRALRRLYGRDLSVNAVDATLVRGKAHEKVVAARLVGARGRRSDAPRLARLMTNRYPLVRYYARASLEQLLGRSARAVDMSLPGPELRREIERWISAPETGSRTSGKGKNQ